jgi:hypothetical protein
MTNGGKRTTVTPDEMEQLSVKLAEWSNGLSESERGVLKHMMLLGRNAPSAGGVQGFALDPSEFRREGFKPLTVEEPGELDANFFKLMCW